MNILASDLQTQTSVKFTCLFTDYIATTVKADLTCVLALWLETTARGANMAPADVLAAVAVAAMVITMPDGIREESEPQLCRIESIHQKSMSS